MKERLNPVNKEDTKYPSIEKTRSISILPKITIIFELAIVHNLEATIKITIILRKKERVLLKF